MNHPRRGGFLVTHRVTRPNYVPGLARMSKRSFFSVAALASRYGFLDALLKCNQIKKLSKCLEQVPANREIELPLPFLCIVRISCIMRWTYGTIEDPFVFALIFVLIVACMPTLFVISCSGA